MTRFHLSAALLAFGSLAILPACTVSATRASNPAPVVYSSSPGLSPNMISQVQTTLQQQGLYKGTIDGVWGPQTQSAVQSFQQSHALRPTGELNSPTLAALNLPGNNVAPPVQPVAAAPADTSSAAPAPTPIAPMPAVAATAPPVTPTP
jgi:peptidoglycan hydrolase-like protein with peptidoglycan-binding domain